VIDATAVSLEALTAGREHAARLFTKRSKRGYRQVEIHISEEQLAAVYALGYAQGYGQGWRAAAPEVVQ